MRNTFVKRILPATIVSVIFSLCILFNANAITRLKVNGMQSLVFENGDNISLTFEADTSQPGGNLVFEIYLDIFANGIIDTGDINLLSEFDYLHVTDGVAEGQIADEDGVVNSEIVMTVNYKDYFLANLMYPNLIFRAIDEDGSSATVSVFVKQQEYPQAVAGQVLDVDGNPVKNMVIVAHPEYRYRILGNESVDVEEKVEDFIPYIPVSQPISRFVLTGKNGRYSMSLPEGNYSLTVLPKQGYYLVAEDYPGFLNKAIHYVVVEPGEKLFDLDFVIAEDFTSPIIEHQPVETAYINNSVEITAEIRDDESGLSRASGYMPFFQREPIVYFRAKGSDSPFSSVNMFVKYDWKPPIMEDSSFSSEIMSPVPFPPLTDSHKYSAIIPAKYVQTPGIEYFIKASDNAKNTALEPINAPSTLHSIEINRSPYIVSGKVMDEAQNVLEGFDIYSHKLENYYRRIEEVRTKTNSDGTYELNLPSNGKWVVSVILPHQYYVISPDSPEIRLEITDKGKYKGNDFVLGIDKTPPLVEHNPEVDVTASTAGEDVKVNAKITDESRFIFAQLVVLSGTSWPYTSYAKPNEEDTFTFVIPGHLIQGDVEYYIEARDEYGNLAIHPTKNPKESPHHIEIQKPLYTVSGTVTIDVSPVQEITVLLRSKALYYRTQTDKDGRFSFPAKPGIWEIEVRQYGYSPSEPIQPIKIEAEGDYEVSINLIKDRTPPSITHVPVESYTFGEPMVVKAEVTDNAVVESVALRLKHDWDIAVAEQNDDVDIATFAPEPFIQYIKMETEDGSNYTVDLNQHLRLFSKSSAIDYYIEARDVAGNRTIAPENASEQVYSVPLVTSQVISGTVKVEDKPVEGIQIYLLNSLFKIYGMTDSQGKYTLPASVGTNSVSVEARWMYEVISPESKRHTVEVEENQSYDEIEFVLKQVDDIVPEPWDIREGEVTLAEDVNVDQCVDIFDLVIVGSHFGEKTFSLQEYSNGKEQNPDVNEDGMVDIFDLVLVGRNFGKNYTNAAPPIMPNKEQIAFDRVLLKNIYDILKPKASLSSNIQLALFELEQLIDPVTQTILHQNYPNPFNPETWIPFELAEQSDVTIRIYNVNGQLVRQIKLGNLPAGRYHQRNRAAYWDGRNASGEKVSSGIYFYHLQSQNYNATRRMLILK